MLEIVFDGREKGCKSVLLLFCYEVDYYVYMVERICFI